MTRPIDDPEACVSQSFGIAALIIGWIEAGLDVLRKAVRL